MVECEPEKKPITFSEGSLVKEGEIVKFSENPDDPKSFLRFGIIKNIRERKDSITLTCGLRDECRGKENEITISLKKFLEKAEKADKKELLERANASLRSIQLWKKLPPIGSCLP